MNESRDALKGCSGIGSHIALVTLGAVAGALVTVAVMLSWIEDHYERKEYLEGFQDGVLGATKHDGTFPIIDTFGEPSPRTEGFHRGLNAYIDIVDSQRRPYLERLGDTPAPQDGSLSDIPNIVPDAQ